MCQSVFRISEDNRVDHRFWIRPESFAGDTSRPDEVPRSCARVDFWRLSPSSGTPESSPGDRPSSVLKPSVHPAAKHPSIHLAYPKLEHMLEQNEDDEPSDPPGTWVHVVVAQEVMAVGMRLRDTPLLLVAVYDWRKGVCLGVGLRFFSRVGSP